MDNESRWWTTGIVVVVVETGAEITESSRSSKTSTFKNAAGANVAVTMEGECVVVRFGMGIPIRADVIELEPLEPWEDGSWSVLWLL